MFEFAWLWALTLLPLPLLFRLLPPLPKQESAALRVPKLDKDLSNTPSPVMSGSARLFVPLLIWLCLVLAAARPQWLGEPINIPAKGRELMLAVDLSGSMAVEDMVLNGRAVDRLTMIKAVLGDFIARRIGDRLGLILFADTAYQQAPLTYDRHTVEQLLDEAVINLVGKQTAIGDAIGLAVKRFEEQEDSNKVLVLLTDGQNTAGNLDPMQALELAKHHGVTIYTIGVGADEMQERGLLFSRTVNPSRDLDEKMLTELASQTGGQYFRAKDTQGLESIYATLDMLEPIERDARQMRPLTALFHYPLALALLLSCMMCLPAILRSVLSKRSL
ncbi:VWA domain-containing protein [Aliiglaciecola sp. CAU 1673]|uniref:vWA domain-containing protein n=1 Tax=Aliiglaciecola sp. CAU 1673 TaxID=3032595 RepID=UPI0023DA7863|nr:VWA domain-containing protein [Aliiglaciecola sp. CAU 1673]MDF2177105.1 VWA domain-containing protein [Aliiglaciecola sp. CAU 1673]